MPHKDDGKAVVVERLEFDRDSNIYHAYHASQHLVRYATACDLVKGKRVLDAACGAGYGSRLLLDWGAAEVVGVDISSEAISQAKETFGRDGLTFLVADAHSLQSVLETDELFDVVVSFETIEHLEHPGRFLDAILKLRKENGVIIISCPNDTAYGNEIGDNPYHLNIFKFEQIKTLLENSLGVASQWLLGAPVVGEINYNLGDKTIECGHSDPNSIMDINFLRNTVLIPSQADLEVDIGGCSHFIGVWGADVGINAVISAQSVQKYHEPWKLIAWLKQSNEDIFGRLNRLSSEMDDLRAASYFNAQQAQRIPILEDETKEKSEKIERLNAVISNQKFRLNKYDVRSYGTSFWKTLWTSTRSSLHVISRTTKVSKHDIDLVRTSDFFDPIWYLENYSDIAEGNVDPLLHYMCSGAREGRSPGPKFDALRYLEMYPDVAKAGQNPLLHYICNGEKEGRIRVPFNQTNR